jgi:hypothetical protein
LTPAQGYQRAKDRSVRRMARLNASRVKARRERVFQRRPQVRLEERAAAVDRARDVWAEAFKVEEGPGRPCQWAAPAAAAMPAADQPWPRVVAFPRTERTRAVGAQAVVRPRAEADRDSIFHREQMRVALMPRADPRREIHRPGVALRERLLGNRRAGRTHRPRSVDQLPLRRATRTMRQKPGIEVQPHHPLVRRIPPPPLQRPLRRPRRAFRMWSPRKQKQTWRRRRSLRHQS